MKKLISIFCLFLFLTGKGYSTITPQEIITPGGLKAWLLYDPNTPVISLAFGFKGGARLDPKGKERTAALTASILSDGTMKKSPKQFSEYLQDYAFSIEFSVDSDFLSGSLTLLKTNEKEGFSLLKEIFQHPRFIKEEFNKAIDEAKSSLANQVRDPSYLAGTKLRQMLFHDHSYANMPIGTPESIKKISLQDIKNYFKDNLTQDRLLIAVTGNITKEETIKMLDEVFSPLPKSGKPLEDKVIKPNIEGQSEFIEMNIPQSSIHFALPGIMYNDPNFLKISILIHIVGGGQASRLFKEIREDRGLAYDASAYITWAQEAGYISGFVGTTGPKTAESIAITKEVWENVVKNGITQKELDDAKNYMIYSNPLRFTNSKLIAGMLLGFQEGQRPIDYFQTRDKQIRAITLEEMNKFIKTTIQPEKMTFLVVGRKIAEKS